MKKITRTIYGTYLETMQLLGLPYLQSPNTTLNEKFDIFPDLRPDNNAVPRARYFCIGMGGHRALTGTDGKMYLSPIQHRPEDAALFDHLPFLVREPENDLSITERAKYALRKVISVRGQNYVAYYLKRFDLTEANPGMKINTVVDETVSSIPFVPTSANLNPQPPEISNTGVVTSTGQYLSASAMVKLNFTAQDVAELVNVAQVLYDNELYAVISEIGVVAGEDKTVTVATPGGNMNYKEVVSATIVAHMTTYYSVGFLNQGFDFTLELGATEPLIGIADVPPSP